MLLSVIYKLSVIPRSQALFEEKTRELQGLDICLLSVQYMLMKQMFCDNNISYANPILLLCYYYL